MKVTLQSESSQQKYIKAEHMELDVLYQAKDWDTSLVIRSSNHAFIVFTKKFSDIYTLEEIQRLDRDYFKCETGIFITNE